VVWAKHRCWHAQVHEFVILMVLQITDVHVRTLVHNFPEASLGTSVAVDRQIFQTDVYSASYPPGSSSRPRKLSRWGERAVVALIGIRLGLDGINPIYYDKTKVRGGFFAFSRTFI
jgi:Peptidase family C54